MCNFNVDFSKFFWGLCPQTSILGRGYSAPPQTPPPSVLRRFAPPRLAPSIVVFPPPYKNPGYAPDSIIFFCERVVDRWNGVDQCVIDSATVNSFKNGLQRTLHNKTDFFVD